MHLTRNKLYGIAILSCFLGYAWLFANLAGQAIGPTRELSICFIKHVTNIPCPACGSTRSVLSILQGEYLQAFQLNPFGFIIFSIMIITPIWIIYDYLKQASTLMRFYHKAETILSQKRIAIPAILMVLTNWFWNIYKGL